MIRVVCSFFIGAGTFGPDGTGAEAAVVLGGHPDPPFPILISRRCPRLERFGGAVTAWLARKWDNAWAETLVCGFVGGCAPLLLVPSCMAGDAPAIALAASGVALAWWQKPLFGGLVAGLSLGVKAIAVPLWLLLPAGLIWSTQKVRFAFFFLGLLPGSFSSKTPSLHCLASPNAGLLGSWWLATEGQSRHRLPPRNGMASLQATQLPPT